MVSEKYAFFIGSTPQPRSRRVLRALLAHSRLPNAQACTPKQTALDIQLHQHTFGAALPTSARQHSAIGAGLLLVNTTLPLPHTTASVPPSPHVISPSLSHPIKRVWYVHIHEVNLKVCQSDWDLHRRVQGAPAPLACASFRQHRVSPGLLLI